MPTEPAPPPRAKGDQVSLVDSFKRLADWLREHDAIALMKTLSPGAKPVLLSKLEQKLGFKVPPGLRALWLMHDGQRSAADSLVGTLHLLPVSWVLNERPATLALLTRMRAAPDHQKEAGLTRDEARSDRWLPVASSRTDRVVVNSDTGRVFASIDEAPYLEFVAASVPAWLETYVDDVERDEYELVIDSEGSALVLRED
jgi:cell wall assembly regulator SMI1